MLNFHHEFLFWDAPLIFPQLFSQKYGLFCLVIEKHEVCRTDDSTKSRNVTRFRLVPPWKWTWKLNNGPLNRKIIWTLNQTLMFQNLSFLGLLVNIVLCLRPFLCVHPNVFSQISLALTISISEFLPGPSWKYTRSPITNFYKLVSEFPHFS